MVTPFGLMESTLCVCPGVPGREGDGDGEEDEDFAFDLGSGVGRTGNAPAATLTSSATRSRSFASLDSVSEICASNFVSTDVRVVGRRSGERQDGQACCGWLSVHRIRPHFVQMGVYVERGCTRATRVRT